MAHPSDISQLVNRRWLLAERPVGKIETEHFWAVEEAVPEPAEGQFLVRVTHLSFAPGTRGWITDDLYMPVTPIGGVVRGMGVGQVVASRHPGFRVGQMVQGGFGWQDYALTDGATDLLPVTPIPPGATPEQALGVFGLTGMTAWFGLMDVGKPQPGETVLVTAAAGATGSVVVQLAKAAGCRVVGVAGGPEKCAWVTDVAGADACLDYRSRDFWPELQRATPDGVNLVFENVGGGVMECGIMRLAERGRVVLCGMISTYDNHPRAQRGVRFLSNLTFRRGRLEGFLVLDYAPRFPEAVAALGELMAQGRLRTVEDVQEGFDNIPATLCRLFAGRNLGKQLLRLADPPLPVVQ